MVHMGKNDKIDGFYQEYEVFSRRTDTAPLQHQFSLLAPNEKMALIMAKENFLRREPAVDIWVAKREHITTGKEIGEEIFHNIDNKQYRETKGYGYLKKRWRKYEQKILDEKEIFSWAGGDQRENKHRKR